MAEAAQDLNIETPPPPPAAGQAAPPPRPRGGPGPSGSFIVVRDRYTNGLKGRPLPMCEL